MPAFCNRRHFSCQAYHFDPTQNGQLASIGEYLDDQSAGEWVWWYENGQKAVVEKFEQGRLIGNWRWWDEHGKLTKQQTYTRNELASTDEVTRGKVAGRHVKSFVSLRKSEVQLGFSGFHYEVCSNKRRVPSRNQQPGRSVQ